MVRSAYEALYKVLMNINDSGCRPYGMASALIVIGVSAWYPDMSAENSAFRNLFTGPVHSHSSSSLGDHRKRRIISFPVVCTMLPLQRRIYIVKFWSSVQFSSFPQFSGKFGPIRGWCHPLGNPGSAVEKVSCFDRTCHFSLLSC